METVPKEAIDLLTALGDKLGLTIEQLWPYFVKQQVLSSIIEVGAFIIGLFILSLPIIYIVYKKYPMIEKNNWNEPSPSTYAMLLGVNCLIFIVSLFSFLVQLSYLITKFFNPEYAAIRSIVKLLK